MSKILAWSVVAFTVALVIVGASLNSTSSNETEKASTRLTTYCALEMEDVYPLIKAYRDKDAAALTDSFSAGKCSNSNEESN